ncbi:MAG: DEAD/DEAH box helicase [Methanothrix sp.]|nr:DEAD/DEAH box helicase [Methanothrix sp.]
MMGGKLSASGTSWSFPGYSQSVYQLIRQFNPELDSTVSHLLEGFGFSLPGEIETDHPSWDKMFQFQKEAISYLILSPHRGSLLALSPGLGKSAVATVASDLLNYDRVLIIAPLSLLSTWEREYRKWSWRDDPPKVRHGKNPEGNIVITNYDTVVRHVDEYCKAKFQLVILDESILVKNRDTRRFKALKRLTLGVNRLWLLSGNPVSREVDDLWAQFHLIDPPSFSSYWRFAESYCIIESPPWGRGVVGSRNLDFQSEFRDLMFVRHQKDVLDLPELIPEVIDLPLTVPQKKLYEAIHSEFMAELTSKDNLLVPNKVAQLIRLQQIVSNSMNLDPDGGSHSSKLDAVVEMVETGYFDFPALIWVHWTEGALQLWHALEKLLPGKVEIILGGDPYTDYKITEYKEGKKSILILSLGVGKYGHTLTNTRTVIYFDRTWDMDAFIQSSYRVQRIGLDHTAAVITLRCPSTVDDLVQDNLSGKAIVVSQITNADLASLLKNLKGGI